MRTESHSSPRGIFAAVIITSLLVVLTLAGLVLLTWREVFTPRQPVPVLQETPVRRTPSLSPATPAPSAFPTAQSTAAATIERPPEATSTAGGPATTPVERWETASQSYFYGAVALDKPWQQALSKQDATYNSYRQQTGVHLTTAESRWVTFSPPERIAQKILANTAFIEIALAFEPGQKASGVWLACGFDSAQSFTGLHILPGRWEMVKQAGGSRATLAEGEMPVALTGGEWSWFRLECTGKEMRAWQSETLLADLSIEDEQSAGPAVGIDPGKVWLFFQRTLMRVKGDS